MTHPSTRDRRGWERIWAEELALSGYWYEPEPAVLEWARGLAQGARVLDLGCGVGRHTIPLARMGLRVVGGDIAPSGLAACAARMEEADLSPLLVRHDMAHLPFADGLFDGLLAFHVVYHTTLAGLRATLAEIRRVLRAGGWLYLTFLGRLEENIARRRADVARGVCREVEPFTFIYLREIRDDKDIPHHYCDEAELRELLSGFEVEALVPVHTEYVDDDGTHHVSLHYHIQARRPVASNQQRATSNQ